MVGARGPGRNAGPNSIRKLTPKAFELKRIVMIKRLVRSAALLTPILLLTTSVIAQEQQFADLGDFRLASGEVIKECRIGYRTFGKLNQDKSNVVLFPTWASGTSEQLKSNIGRGRLVDDTRYFVVAVDALSNGVSSSPSNSRRQPRMSFPKITMADVVNTQHELLTKILHLNHLYAVLGVSMGGMQTFQWMVSYPDFMDRAVPIAGSPRLAPYDLLQWQTQLDAILHDADWNQGNYTVNPARAAEAEFGALLLTTPDHFNQESSREKVFAEIERGKADSHFDANDKIRQVQAMMSLDVSAPFKGSLEEAAARVKARTFVIVSTKDHVVTPGPALEFARLMKARLLVLEGDCGHLAPSCEAGKVNPAVAAFLSD